MNIAGAPKDDNTHRLAVLNTWVVPNSFPSLRRPPASILSTRDARAHAIFFSSLNLNNHPFCLILLQSGVTTTSQPASQPATDWASCPLPSSATCIYHLSSSVISVAVQIPAVQNHKIRLPFESSFFFSLSLSFSDFFFFSNRQAGIIMACLFVAPASCCQGTHISAPNQQVTTHHCLLLLCA